MLLVDRQLVRSRTEAQALIMAGEVRLNGQLVLKAGMAVDPEASVEVLRGPRFVSRGGEKLDAALEAFRLDVRGRVCADVGASTGGFTDCLLQRGAERVYAIDVGKGILHWKLRQDERVVVMEKTNARFVKKLPEAVWLSTIDASFISLRVLLPVVHAWPGTEAGGGGHIVALIKPQFEAGRREVARGKGVIRNLAVHRQILNEVLEFSNSLGLQPRGLTRSPLVGPKGNAEFLVWLAPGREAPLPSITDLVQAALSEATSAGQERGDVA